MTTEEIKNDSGVEEVSAEEVELESLEAKADSEEVCEKDSEEEVETKLDEEIVEEKSAEDTDISLEDVADALEAKSEETKELIESKVSKDELEEVKSESEESIKTLNDKVEELEAKTTRPSISKKGKTKMENKEILSVFARKGVDGLEGLRSKGADLRISTDAQGGFALPTEVSSEIIKLQHETSPMRQVCNSINVSTTDYSQLASIGSAASGWVGEVDARAATNSPELAKVSAVMGEIYAAPKAFQHVLEDSFFDIESWLTGEVSRQFNEQEGVAFLSGNGTNKPAGLLNGLATTSAYTAGDATRAFGKFQVIKSGQAATLGANSDAIINKLRDVVKTVKTGYLPGSKWMMNRNTHNTLVNMKDSDGNYFLQRDISKGAADTLFGYDIVINEDMADVAAGNYPIIFGDFSSGMVIVDRVGVSMLRDPYSAYGAVSFYTRKRVGSMIQNTEALKFVNVSA